MSRAAYPATCLPGPVKQCLRKIGADLRAARERKGRSLRAWARDMDVSVPTLRRMEAGDPAVGVSVYLVALWLAGRIDALKNIAGPSRLAEERVVGRRKQQPIVFHASADLLAEGARFNDEIHRLPTGNEGFVPKGVHPFKTHEEANRHDLECLAEGMARIITEKIHARI